MNYLSVCSGIEAASVAWHSLGWKAVGYSEIEAFPSAVLQHHYPGVTNFGDMTKYKEWKIERTVDLLVGGTPCQSFSVAGLRKGLADPRGNLALTYCGILDYFRPKWFVWENVPGVLSSNGGRDFGSFLGALVELGYGFAYRVLDAQYFGVAQRRRRVFVVGYLGDWRPAAEVLFEPESLRGDSPPRRGKGQEIANCFTSSPSQHRSPNEDATLIPSYALQGAGHTSQKTNGQGWAENISYTLNTTDVHGVAHPVGVTVHGTDGTTTVASFSDVAQCLRSRTPGNIENSSTTVVAHPIPFDTTQITSPQNKSNPQPGAPCHTLNAQAHVPAVAFNAQQDPDSWQECAGTLDTDGHTQAVAFGVAEQPDIGHCLRSGASKADKHESTTYIAQSMAVRRLTPVECERLQGFPDNYTNIPWRKADQSPDGPRYKALGNSMAVPVMAWIGQRIANYEQ